VKRVANPEIDRLRELTAALKQNLERCEVDPEIEAVHDVRTGTRRVEATLEALLREHSSRAAGGLPPDSPTTDETPLAAVAQRWRQLLKKIRRAAAPVRDLDVHRKLLEKLKRAAAPEASVTDPQPTSAAPSLVEAPAVLPPASPVEQQADDLDAWLKHGRQHHAEPLVKAAPKWAARLDKQFAALEEALLQRPSRLRSVRNAAATALEAFALLSSQMQQLDAGNLHDFRKGAKKARYMAESGGADEHAGAVGKALKKLQDEIGDWHDWLVLAEEAHSALGASGTELTALIESQRDMHFTLAMKTSERMRGRLMGEWQALRPLRPVRRRAPAARPTPIS
jgi:CHAD domain-containing protein